MIVRSTLVIAASAVFAVSCSATLPSDYTYTAGDEKALVVFDSSVASENSTLILAPINQDARRFVRIPAQFLAGSGNRIEASGEGRAYFVEQLDPGHYVLAGVRHETYPPTTQCYARGAPVFEFERGAANVISMATRQLGPFAFAVDTNSEMADPQVRLERAREALAAVPGVGADVPVRLAEQEATVTFNPGARLVGPGCPGASEFEIVESN